MKTINVQGQAFGRSDPGFRGGAAVAGFVPASARDRADDLRLGVDATNPKIERVGDLLRL